MPSTEAALEKSNFASHVIKLAGGTVVAQAVTILVSPFLTRIYSPEDFGVAALFTTITSIIGVVTCLRYELAIPLPKEDSDAANVLSASLLAGLFVAALTGLVFFFGGRPFLGLLKAQALGPYLWAIPVLVLFSAACVALNLWITRMKRFGWLAVTRTSESVIISASQLLLGLIGLVYAGSLIISMVFGVVIACCFLAVIVWRDHKALFRKSVTLKKIKESYRLYRKFPLIDLWGSLLNVASRQAPVLVLGIYFSEAIIGHYALASRLTQLPMTLIGSAVTQVFFQRAAEVHSKGGDLAGLVKVVFRRLVTVALLPSCLIVLTGKDLLLLVFGSNWVDAGVFLQSLGVWLFFWFVSSPLTVLFVVLDRLELAFFAHALLFVARVVPLVIGGVKGDAYLAIGLFTASGVIAYGILLVLNMSLARVSFLSTLRILGLEGLQVLPVVIVVFALKTGLHAPTWMTLSVSLIGLIGYGAFLFRKDPEISGFLRVKFKR